MPSPSSEISRFDPLFSPRKKKPFHVKPNLTPDCGSQIASSVLGAKSEVP